VAKSVGKIYIQRQQKCTGTIGANFGFDLPGQSSIELYEQTHRKKIIVRAYRLWVYKLFAKKIPLSRHPTV